MKNLKLFKDILREQGKYSQGRVYLLWSIIAYYLTIGILTVAGINKNLDIELDKFKIILDALEYAMTLFGGYVFGGKFIDAYKSIKGSKEEQDELITG
tara:strand:+ start:1145 stop:1438 length:294 start_codon:yes stop_codon:yes gene_type:complete